MAENSLSNGCAGFPLKRYKRWVTIASFLSLSLLSQAEQTNRKPKEGHLAILALGPKPTPQYYDPSKNANKANLPEGQSSPLTPTEERQTAGLAVRLRPHRHQIPPTALYLDSLSGEQVKLKIGFNSAPVFRAIPANKPLKLRYYENGEKDDKLSLYMNTEAIEGGTRTLAIMRPPDRPPLMWKSAPETIQMINLEKAVVQKKNFIIINHLSQPVYVTIFGQKKIKVSPNSTIGFPLPGGDRPFAEYEAHADPEAKRSISFGSFAKQKMAVTILAFYQANPKVNGGSVVASFCDTIRLPKAAILEE